MPRFSHVSQRQSRFPRPTDSHGKRRVTLEGSEKGNGNVRTVAVTVMRRHLLAYCDRLDHAEGDVASLAEKLAVIVTVMLSIISRETEGRGNVA
jgi:hypothetical protein